MKVILSRPPVNGVVRASRRPDRSDPCPACDSQDTFVYDDPHDGPELVCMDCIRYGIAEVVEEVAARY